MPAHSFSVFGNLTEAPIQLSVVPVETPPLLLISLASRLSLQSRNGANKTES